jgi:hypothetical protein
MKRFITLLAVTAIVLPTMLACGEKETPEQRLAHLRSRHEIFPAGITSRTDAEGNTMLIVDVQIANQGTDPLSQLTVLVTVRGGDGSERLSQRATLDLEGVQPGVGVRRTAIIPGYQLAEDDEVIVEREANLSPAELRSLPEWSDVEGMER